MIRFKITPVLLCAGIILASSCKKDVTDSKVSVGNNQISIVVDNKKEILTIYKTEYSESGDTVSMYINAKNADSTKGIVLIFNKVILGTKKFDCKGNFLDSLATYVTITYSPHGDTGFMAMPLKDTSYITLLDYSKYEGYEGNFKARLFTFFDSTKFINIEGEFKGATNLVNPEKIKNLPIAQNSLVANIDDVPTLFKAIAGKVTLNGTRKTIITGTSTENQTINIEFFDIEPQLDVEYTFGKIYGAQKGFVKANMVKDTLSTYISDGYEKTSGKVKILKITNNTFQGSFEFHAMMNHDTTLTVDVTNGLFYTKIKNYNK